MKSSHFAGSEIRRWFSATSFGLRRQNHWFDALYNACAAGHLCGVRLVAEPPRPPKPRVSLAELAARARSESWVDTDRVSENYQRLLGK